jgi:hypothetical protein
MPIIANIEDLRRIARQELLRVIYDYVERGSYDELTARLASAKPSTSSVPSSKWR